MNYFKIGEELLKAIMVVIESTRHPYHEATQDIKSQATLTTNAEYELDSASKDDKMF